MSTAMYVKGLEGAISYWKAHQDFGMIAVTDNGEIYLKAHESCLTLHFPVYEDMTVYITEMIKKGYAME